MSVRSGDDILNASLRALVPVGDAVSRSIELRVSISPDFSLAAPPLVGSAVRVAVPTASVQTVVAVPRDAVHLRSRGQHVVVVADGKARVVAVNPGIVSDGWIAVDKVAAGERVVLRGGERLRDGQPVSILAQD